MNKLANNRIIPWRMAAAAVLAVCVGQGPALAGDTYYVSAAGWVADWSSATNRVTPGSYIQGYSQAAAGDTIVYVNDDGPFTQNTTIAPANSGTAGTPITFKAEDGATVELNAGLAVKLTGKNHAYINIEGFVFGQAGTIAIDMRSGDYTNSFIIISNCTFNTAKRWEWGVVRLEGNNHHITIRDCIFRGGYGATEDGQLSGTWSFFNTDGDISGTWDFNAGGTNVSGTGGNAQIELDDGDYIKVAGAGTWYRVAGEPPGTNTIVISPAYPSWLTSSNKTVSYFDASAHTRESPYDVVGTGGDAVSELDDGDFIRIDGAAVPRWYEVNGEPADGNTITIATAFLEGNTTGRTVNYCDVGAAPYREYHGELIWIAPGAGRSIHHCLIENNTFVYGSAHGVFEFQTNTGIIEKNVVRNNSIRNLNHTAFNLYGSGATRPDAMLVENNTMYDAGAISDVTNCYGNLWGSASDMGRPREQHPAIQFSAHRSIVRHNITYNSGGGLDIQNTANDNTFYNNVFYGNVRGLYINTTADVGGNRFVNNAFMNNTVPGTYANTPLYVVLTSTNCANQFAYNNFDETNLVFYRDATNMDGWNSLSHFQSGLPSIFHDNVEHDSDFVDAEARDFQLKNTSALRNAGGALTAVAAADMGSGTNLVVEHARFFQDGFDMQDMGVHADWIAVGTRDNVAKISAIDYDANIITLASAIPRNDDDPVWLYKDSFGRVVFQESAPDIGALEHSPAVWFVRPEPDGPYGLGDGTTYSNAWAGFYDMTWGPGGIDAGDTLYVCGFHTAAGGHYLPVGASGSNGAPIIIDGGYPGDPGMIFGSYKQLTNGWTGPDTYGCWRYDTIGGILDNSFAYEDTGATGDSDNFVRLTRMTNFPDETWAPGSAWISKGTNNFIYYKPTSGVPSDHVFYNESGGGVHIIGRDYITVRNLYIWGANSLVRPRGSHHVRVENCDLRWAAYMAIPIDQGSDHGVIVSNHIYEIGNAIYAYDNAEEPDAEESGWWIAGNRIHHLSDNLVYGVAGDHHAIGWQAGRSNVVERNIIHYGGGPVIAFWQGGGDYYQDHNVIRYNMLVENGPISEADAHWSKSGISLGSSNDATNGAKWAENFVHNNIVMGMGRRAIYTKIVSNNVGRVPCGIYNNVVGGTLAWPNGGEAYESGWTAVFKMKNNVSFDNAGRHYEQNFNAAEQPDYDQIRIDHNLYWSSNGTNTWAWKGVVYEGLSAWQAGTLGDGTPQDAHSVVAAPLFVNVSGTYTNREDFVPAWNSPLIDAGTTNTPGMTITTDILGNPIYGTPDIGAIEYQPPYVMGSNGMDVAGNVRVYADGKFRNTAAPCGTNASLTIEPEGGWQTNDYREWMNVSVSNWTQTAMTWTESSIIASNTAHSLNGLVADCFYDLSVNGVLGQGIHGTGWTNGRAMASTEGVLAFVFTNGYSTNVFELVRSDADQLPDVWEMANFGDIDEVDAGDPDEDGLTNLQEWIAGSDPLDDSSWFMVDGLWLMEAGVRVSFTSLVGRVYAVEWKGDLLGTNAWEALTNDWPGTGGLMEFGDGAGATQRFYRVRVHLP